MDPDHTCTYYCTPALHQHASLVYTRLEGTADGVARWQG